MTVVFLAKLPDSFAIAADWKPITPEELALKTPKVQPDADAEALLWEVRIEDEYSNVARLIMKHYLRVKVFSDRAKDKFATIDIQGGPNTSIIGIAARTIKADGSIVEVKKDSIFDRTVAKASGRRVQAKSFALPAVEPGSIIEYQWTEIHNEDLANYLRLEMQRDIPVWTIRYLVKPLDIPEYRMVSMAFQCKPAGFERHDANWYRMEMQNMPAYVEEPRMPAEYATKSWILLYYDKDHTRDPDKYWKEVGREQYKLFRERVKVNNEIKRTAEELTSSISDPEAKIARLADYCRREIKNVTYRASGVTDEERKALFKRADRTSEDTFKRKIGTGNDINNLFAAMATAIGFESRRVMIADADDAIFQKNFLSTYLLRAWSIAIKVGDKWRFYDPASTYVNNGTLRWQEEGQPALLTDPKEATFVMTPVSEPKASLTKRTAKFALTPDGTLSGDVQIVYSGHSEARQRAYYDDMVASEREQDLKDSLKARLSTAEVSNVSIGDPLDLTKPFSIRYTISVPGYVTRTGRRLFLSPGFFQRNRPPVFSTSTRKHPISFEHPYSEQDQVEFTIPEGFVLDNPEAPGEVRAGDVGGLSIKMAYRENKLFFERDFRWAGIYFEAKDYPALKQMFDAMHAADSHSLAFKSQGRNGDR